MSYREQIRRLDSGADKTGTEFAVVDETRWGNATRAFQKCSVGTSTGRQAVSNSKRF